MTFRPFASAGFDPALIDRTSWTDFGLYCQEARLYISPVLTDQQAAREHFSAIIETCNADFYWSDGLLKVQTYGDTAIGGWTPTLTPAFDLTLQDIIPPSDGEPAISITRMAPTDAYNQCTIEWRNRALDYASSTITAKNDEMIALYGLRAEDAVQCHHVCVAETAAMMAQMRVQRKSMLRDTYQFSLPSRYACLEPMVDLLTLTDPLLGLDETLVRIVTIVERPDGILDITAEGTEIGVCTAIETPSPDPYGYFPDVENLPPGAGGAGSPPLPPAVPMTTLQLPPEFTALDNASTRAGNLTADWTSQAADLIFGTSGAGYPGFMGGETTIARIDHAATAKTTPVDADEFPLCDSAATFGLKKTTLADLKTVIGGGTYTNSDPMPITLGGLPLGKTFAAETIPTVFDELFYPELFPVLVAPSSTFTLTESGYHETGEKIATLHFSASFNRGTITPAYGTSGLRSGLPNTYKYTGTGLSNQTSTSLTDTETVSTYTVLDGAQNWTGAVAFGIGEQPLSSKGNNYATPLAAGDTAMVTRTITGVYPWYATSVAVATLTKQALASMSSSYVQVTMIAEDGVDKQKAAFPDGWVAITSLKQFNTLSGTWDAIDPATFTVTATTETIQGNVIDYDLWTHDGPTIGSRQLRFYA